MTDEVVTRLYSALVDELRRRGHPEGEPVKVSELYQDLVPYRSVRSALGVELNADYEHALLRLLSGERDLLRLEPEEAREELRREVDAPYPFVGLFRKFSASDVWVTMPAAPAETAPDTEPDRDEGAGADPAPQSERRDEGARRVAAEHDAHAGRGGEPVETRGGAAAERAPVRLHHVAPEPSPLDPAARLTHADAACAFCEEPLPSGRRVRFCPHCGGDQRLRPCPRCDAVLERGWQYCISCGHEVAI